MGMKIIFSSILIIIPATGADYATRFEKLDKLP